MLIKVVGSKSGSTVQKKTRCNAQGDQMCELERVTKIGLKRGKCPSLPADEKNSSAFYIPPLDV